MMEKRNVEIGEEFSSYRYNTVEGTSEKAVVASGISYAYAKEFLKDYPDVRLIRIATPYPFPETFVKKALEGVTEVLCVEELSPYNEEQIAKLCGRNGITLTIRGKLTGDVPASGELSTNL